MTEDTAAPTPARPRPSRERVWAAVGPLAALVAFHGAFSVSKVYYLRDLAGHFWGEHLWLRKELFAGHFPIWDPDIAFGQPAIADPMRGMLFPPTLLLRFVPSAALGFNLCVAIPFLVLALGAYLFLRRHVSAPAAALGSAAFVLSGPSISMANFLNLPWAFAFVPWVLYVADLLAERATRRRFAALAAVFALIFLAGEGATMLTAGVLTVAYAAFGASVERPRADRVRAVLLVAAAGAVALMLSAAQALPLAETTSASIRGAGESGRIVRIWSLHPVSLVELVAPQLFGDQFVPSSGGAGWVQALNSGREPLLYSVYLGIGTLALALASALDGPRRRTLFWLAVALAGFTCALGDYVPIYPAMRRVAPFLDSIRYPVKYTIFAAFAVATLAAFGWEALRNGRAATARRALVASTAPLLALGAVALVVMCVTVLAHGYAAGLLARLAGVVGAEPTDAAGKYAAAAFAIVAPRVAALALGAAGCLWLGANARRKYLHATLFALTLFDLFVTSAYLLPTMDVALLGRPEWVAAASATPADRVYVAGRLNDTGVQVDVPYENSSPPVTGDPAEADQGKLLNFLASFPAAHGVRDTFSYDLSLLFPKEYWNLEIRFAKAPLDERRRVLSRLGVRYYLVPWRDFDGATKLASHPDKGAVTLYERAPEVPRARVVSAARVETEPPRRFDGFFDPSPFASSVVALDRPSDGPNGRESAPLTPSAEIVEDASTRVTIDASAPEGGGYLVLLDSYDTNWRAEVDGTPAHVERADGLFRAVHLRAGSHRVTFTYQPRSFAIGLVVSCVTAGLLLVLVLVRRRDVE